MDNICTDRFWDSNLTWGNHRSYPEFTECFQNTFILWLPSMLLFLSAPIYIYYVSNYKDIPTRRTWLYWTKISVIVAQLSVRYLQLNQEPAWNVKYTGLAVEGLALILLMFVTDLERRKAFVTSGLQTAFWFLTSLSGITLLYSQMVKQDYDRTTTDNQLHVSFLLLTLGQFVLTWFPDIHTETYSETACQLSNASFVQRLFFMWFNGFMSIGKTRPVDEDDLSDLMPSEQVENAAVDFDNIWQAEQDKLDQNNRDDSTRPSVNLLKVLIKSNMSILSVTSLLKVFRIALDLFDPLMTGILVGFAFDTEQPLWKGYVYLTLSVFSLFFGRILSNYIEHLSMSTSLRVINCVQNAVVKKAMKLSHKARAENTTGEICNIISEDCRQAHDFIGHIWWCWCVPCEIVLSFLVLYSAVDYAAFASIAILAIVMPLNLISARNAHNTHLKIIDKKDERIKLMTEILNGIKILKLYAWEMAFGKKIVDMRENELTLLKKMRFFRIIGTLCWGIAPFMMGIGTFALYVYISPDHMLSPRAAFQSLGVFGYLTHTFNALPHVIQHGIRSIASIKRIQKLLNNEELDETNVSHGNCENAIQIENGTFTWNEKLGPCLKDINIKVPKGGLVGIVGSVGAGKSSLLSAILGEIEKEDGNVNVDGGIAYVSQQAWILNDTLKNNILFRNKYQEKTYNDVLDACSLRRDLDILTAKDQTEIGEKGINLSGGQKQRVNIARAVYFNADIYLLDDPLSAVDSHVGKEIFENVISENGLLKNKTRVLVTHGITWLPRMDMIICVEDGKVRECGTYNELMANESDFSKFIQKHSHSGNLSDSSDDEENIVQDADLPELSVSDQRDTDLVLGMLGSSITRQQITNVNSCSDADSGYLSDNANEAMARNKKILQRSISESFAHERENEKKQDDPKHKLKKIKSFDNKFKLNEKRLLKEQEKLEKGKMIEEDELEKGQVNMKHVKPYLKSIGTWICIATVLLFAVKRLTGDLRSYWIQRWTSDDTLTNLTATSSDSVLRTDTNIYYIQVYLLIGLVHSVAALAEGTLISFGIYRGAKFMHETMLKNILRGPMSFFDTTPIGRIVNRFSTDLSPLDGAIADHSMAVMNCIYGLITAFVVLFMSVPKFIVIIIPLMYMYNEIKKQYVPIKRSLERLRSKQVSPYFSHVTESLNGVQVIRAYGMTENFTQNLRDKYTAYSKTRFHIISSDRWVDARLNFINIMCFSLSAYFALTDRENLGAAMVGMVMTYAFDINGSLEWFVRMAGEIEQNMVSLERVSQYCTTPQEAPLHTSVMPEKSWPENGNVEIDDYSLRYREGHELVLKDINIKVNPGEKVGIVGRTGAGKSSLTLGLFRLIEPASGRVTIDDHDISQLGLFDLRSKLTILPQEPVLFSGTLRSNLDPLNDFPDEAIFNALEHAHLKTFIDSLPDKLNYDCGEGGQNLSVGQRQLICLARSLLRKSNVLILDEATAAVDMETDALIQETIKQEFRDCTVLTIAHRLNTIVDYDRIIVLDKGQVKEFDSPKSLLDDRNSAFYSMARDAGLVR